MSRVRLIEGGGAFLRAHSWEMGSVVLCSVLYIPVFLRYVTTAAMRVHNVDVYCGLVNSAWCDVQLRELVSWHTRAGVVRQRAVHDKPNHNQHCTRSSKSDTNGACTNNVRGSHHGRCMAAVWGLMIAVQRVVAVLAYQRGCGAGVVAGADCSRWFPSREHHFLSMPPPQGSHQGRRWAGME